MATSLASLLVLGAAPAPSPVPWWGYALIVGGSLAVGGLLLFMALRTARDREVPCGHCGRIMMQEWSECMFCHTPRGVKSAVLEFSSGPLAGRIIRLDGEVTTFGSAAGCTVVLGDTAVSRRHVGIRRGDGTYELADLGSTNGVYVNGEKVAKRQLQVGDVIRIGTSEMVFRSR